MAQVRVILGLKQMIVNAQKDDVKLQEIVQLVYIGDKTDYAIDESGSCCTITEYVYRMI